MTAPMPAPFTGETLDPEIRRFQALVTEAFGRFPPFGQVTPAEARQIAERVRAPWAAGGPAMDRTLKLEIDGVRVRLHDPKPGPAKPALIYLHGGGWTLFSIDTHDRVMREYAERAGVVVVGIDYALAPEAKFPQALNQIASVVRRLQIRGSEMGIDSRRLAIGGDSAGGNLAIATCLKLRAEGNGDALKAMILNYGVFDCDGGRASYQRYGGPGHMLESTEMAGFWRHYLRDEADRQDPLACPLRADLHNLPPAFLAIAEQDVLHDENIALAARLRTAGVPVEAITYAGTGHSFLEAVSIAAVSRRAFADASAWLAELMARLR
jgi:acetyl esterase